ncbi:MAG: lipoate--protein ligase family protein [Verrucomicrobiota bacterium]
MNWHNINSGPSEAAFNMALDDALLESIGTLGAPVLRFYGWTQPAATFGYFQHFAEIECTTLLRPLIRRPTGGGLVPHDADWTYSLAFPPGHEWHELRAEDSYRSVHEWIQRAFAKLNVATEVAPCCKKTAPGQCFVGHEKFDLLWHGKKIAGAAQRRNKLGLLIQGSVQPPPLGLSREAWEEAMRSAAPSTEGWSELVVNGDLLGLTQKLVAEKYSQTSYNQKR